MNAKSTRVTRNSFLVAATLASAIRGWCGQPPDSSCGSGATGSGSQIITQAALATRPAPALGTLPKFNLTTDGGRPALNGAELTRVTGHSIILTTQDRASSVRVSFLKTVRMIKGVAVEPNDRNLLAGWTNGIPMVSRLVGLHQPLGTLEPVLYEILKPKNRDGVELREKIVLLWSTEQSDAKRIGQARLMPAVSFPRNGYIADVQYRGMKQPAKEFVGRALLQLLYIQDHSQQERLAAFVILCKPNGEYEFYLAPWQEMPENTGTKIEEANRTDDASSPLWDGGPEALPAAPVRGPGQ